MKNLLNDIEQKTLEELSKVKSSSQLEEIRVKVLGKKGKLTEILRGMGSLAPDERPKMGKMVNDVRSMIEEKMKIAELTIHEVEKEERLNHESIDITVPGRKRELGKVHPLTSVLKEFEDIFIGMGFKIEEGPEIEYDYYNFEALNIPKYHPSRDTQDTFYITDNILLRTQTSPIQARVMQSQKPPIRIITPGTVYRSDDVDATHSPMFHQIEGLVVDKNIGMSDLRGTISVFVKKLFGEDTKIKFRPHHFPFTEPSAEVDVSCFKCGGKGCKVCKNSGWIEILGAGMVHPKVLKMSGIDPEVYSGFAFGLGLDRIVLEKYEIDDLRLLYENDLRFLKQF